MFSHCSRYKYCCRINYRYFSLKVSVNGKKLVLNSVVDPNKLYLNPDPENLHQFVIRFI